ncbi:MAG: hypothetical protein P1U36_05455 [Legionellaceae bacterium]|nr:hypothetical protein [Legionellaceae bacterium]
MTVYILPLDAPKLNENQFMFGYNWRNQIDFDWSKSYDAQDFDNYFQDLSSEQKFLVFETMDAASDYAESNEGVNQPGCLVTIRSRVPVYEVELYNDSQQKEILKSDVKTLLCSSLGLYGRIYNFEEERIEKKAFDLSVERLKGLSLELTLNPDVTKSLHAVIDCIQQPEYKFLGFKEKKEIIQKTISFINQEITPKGYKAVINKGYLGKQGSPELKNFGAALMALAVAVTASLLTAGAAVPATLLMGAGLGLMGSGFFDMGKGSGISKPLHEVLDASPCNAPPV